MSAADAAAAALHVCSEHYADELEMELADTLLEEFQVEVEDGSPAQVCVQNMPSLWCAVDAEVQASSSCTWQHQAEMPQTKGCLV